MGTMTQEIDTLKSKLIEMIKLKKSETDRKVQVFKLEKKKIEDEYEKYFKDLKKYSDLYEMSFVEKSKNFHTSMYPLDNEGNLDYSKGLVTIDVTKVTYKEYQISIPTSKLPKGFPTVHISVEEHITYSRRGYSQRQGIKIKFTLGWEKEKFYKSGRVITETILNRIESVKHEGVRKEKENEFSQKIHKYLNEKYPNMWSQGIGFVYNVTLNNGVLINLSFRFNDELILKPELKSVHLPTNKNVENMIEILKTM